MGLTKKKYKFDLFISGETDLSNFAIGNIKSILEKNISGQYEFEIIDIQDHPEIASKEQIITLPMLIKKSPLPEIRVTGDFSDKQKVLHDLLIYN